LECFGIPNLQIKTFRPTPALAKIIIKIPHLITFKAIFNLSPNVKTGLPDSLKQGFSCNLLNYL
jgi:hypothetical protein